MSMPCLAIKQPWAGLIIGTQAAPGLKDVENRPKPWPSTIPLPAEILVLASKTQPSSEEMAAACKMLADDDSKRKLIYATRFEALPFGAILGTVTVTGCVTDSKSPWAAEGQHHYLLESPKPFKEPVPFAAGRLGVFQAPDVAALHRPHDGSTRRVDVKDELADVMITRPRLWGNPFRTRKKDGCWAVEQWDKVFGAWFDLRNRYLDPYGPCDTEAEALACCLEAYESRLRHNNILLAQLHELKGLRLGCYCGKDDPCHGDVLARLVKEVCGA